MGKKRFISKEIEDFYNEVSEESRLTGGLGPLEFKRNKELIEKFIPSPNSTVLDVGGGTGRYAEWLANKGHNVSLVEPIEKHVKLAQKRAKKSNKKFTVHLAEARNLDFIDMIKGADLLQVLVHGRVSFVAILLASGVAAIVLGVLQEGDEIAYADDINSSGEATAVMNRSS